MHIFTYRILRKYSLYFQNAKVSVMGSAQLSQVMTTISKYGIELDSLGHTSETHHIDQGSFATCFAAG